MSKTTEATVPPGSQAVHQRVKDRYGALARQVSASDQDGQATPASCCGPTKAGASSSCCGSSTSASDSIGFATPEPVGAASMLYDNAEIAELPESVTAISLGCGNPTAIASLQPGQTVLDLGSGGGIDCFLAARQVGPEGHVIGLDMTTDMIRLARRNAKKLGLTNVEFRWGEIEEMPVADASVDVVISNCVINLSPDKPQVFREAYRVLKPGGHLAVSDMVFEVPVPEALRTDLDSWAGCVAGAWLEDDYLAAIRAAGFTDVTVAGRDFLPINEVLSEGDIARLRAQANGHLRGVAADRVMASIKVQARKE